MPTLNAKNLFLNRLNKNQQAISTKFNHQSAQKYEIRAATKTINRYFLPLYAKRQQAQHANKKDYPGPKNQFFDNETQAWSNFIFHCRNRSCLEIGCGPFGIITDWYWAKKIYLIDPLVKDYQHLQKQMFKKTYYPPQSHLYAQPAETLIPSLKNKITGAIVCRNALDHTSDPLTILTNISLYATKGCHLLLWTDLWHIDGADTGHRNITKSVPAFKALLSGFGFSITHQLKSVRSDGSTIEFGCRAIKIRSTPSRVPQINPHEPHSTIV